MCLVCMESFLVPWVQLAYQDASPGDNSLRGLEIGRSGASSGVRWVLGGVATLSGDARSLVSPDTSAFSSYDPVNGGAVEVLVGKHFSDYISIQADYIWNSNGLTLTSAAFNNGTQQGFQETRNSSQQSLIGDLLVYFRKRDGRLRPYLSVGTGLVHFASSQERIEQLIGTPDLPPQHFTANMIALHVPVAHPAGWIALQVAVLYGRVQNGAERADHQSQRVARELWASDLIDCLRLAGQFAQKHLDVLPLDVG